MIGYRVSATRNGPFACATRAVASNAKGITRYVIYARPAPGLPFSPTFLGLGPLMPNPFLLRKQLPSAMSLEGRVVSDSRPAGIGGTVVQVYCDPSEPDCLDSFLPMAEGITDGSGAFKMGLPDPKSR